MDDDRNVETYESLYSLPEKNSNEMQPVNTVLPTRPLDQRYVTNPVGPPFPQHPLNPQNQQIIYPTSGKTQESSTKNPRHTKMAQSEEINFDDLFYENHHKLSEEFPQVVKVLTKFYDIVFKVFYYIIVFILSPFITLAFAIIAGVMSAVVIWIVNPSFKISLYILAPVSDLYKTILRMFMAPTCQSIGYYWSMFVFRTHSLPDKIKDETIHV